MPAAVFTESTARRVLDATRRVEGGALGSSTGRGRQPIFGTVMLAKAAENISEGADGNVTLYEGNTLGSETATSRTVKAWARHAAVSNGDWLHVVPVQGGLDILGPSGGGEGRDDDWLRHTTGWSTVWNYANNAVVNRVWTNVFATSTLETWPSTNPGSQAEFHDCALDAANGRLYTLDGTSFNNVHRWSTSDGLGLTWRAAVSNGLFIDLGSATGLYVASSSAINKVDVTDGSVSSTNTLTAGTVIRGLLVDGSDNYYTLEYPGSGTTSRVKKYDSSHSLLWTSAENVHSTYNNTDRVSGGSTARHWADLDTSGAGSLWVVFDDGAIEMNGSDGTTLNTYAGTTVTENLLVAQSAGVVYVAGRATPGSSSSMRVARFSTSGVVDFDVELQTSSSQRPAVLHASSSGVTLGTISPTLDPDDGRPVALWNLDTSGVVVGRRDDGISRLYRHDGGYYAGLMRG